MARQAQVGDATRLIFAGNAELADGFALVGFETLPDASVEQLDQLLGELTRQRQNAFVVIDQQLAAQDSHQLPRIHSESAHIVVVEVPELARPEDFLPHFDEQIDRLVGERVTEDD